MNRLSLVLMERILMPCLIENVLDEANNSFQKCNNVTDDILMALYAIFGRVLDSALSLVDSDSVTLLKLKHCSAKLDECLLQVLSSNGPSYTLFVRTNYCQCSFYKQKVLASRSYPACKHVVAANLAYIWKKYKKYEIDFNTYKAYIDDLLSPI